MAKKKGGGFFSKDEPSGEDGGGMVEAVAIVVPKVDAGMVRMVTGNKTMNSLMLSGVPVKVSNGVAMVPKEHQKSAERIGFVQE